MVTEDGYKNLFALISEPVLFLLENKLAGPHLGEPLLVSLLLLGLCGPRGLWGPPQGGLGSLGALWRGGRGRAWNPRTQDS